MLLILTEPSDQNADYIAQKLQERSANFIRFNPAQFPSQAEVSLSYSSTERNRYTLRASGESIDLNDLQAVWYRRPKSPVPHEQIIDSLSRNIVEGENRIFMSDVWNTLDCLWLPGHPFVVQRAQLKATQLKVSAELGFELPPTLFTNSPEEFLEFYRKHNGNVVSKLVGSSFNRFGANTFSRYTEVVSKRDIAYAHSVRYCPLIFQAYIPKRVELRITVVGQKVFAAEIHSQESNHTCHDWRRYDNYKMQYLIHELPIEVEQHCVQLVQRLELCYGAIDMILTPDGRYVFLEINPNGQYLWIEEATGLPISDAICDLLISGSPINKPAESQLESYAGDFR